jgi:hypothetical protein
VVSLRSKRGRRGSRRRRRRSSSTRSSSSSLLFCIARCVYVCVLQNILCYLSHIGIYIIIIIILFSYYYKRIESAHALTHTFRRKKKIEIDDVLLIMYQ